MLKTTLAPLVCIAALALAACGQRTETKLVTKVEFVKETVSPELLADFSRRHRITFPLLSDTGSATVLRMP